MSYKSYCQLTEADKKKKIILGGVVTGRFPMCVSERLHILYVYMGSTAGLTRTHTHTHTAQ